MMDFSLSRLIHLVFKETFIANDISPQAELSFIQYVQGRAQIHQGAP